MLVEAVQTAGSQPEGSAVLAVLAGLALALWSASAGMAAMQSGLNIAYDIDQDRTFVKKRLVALLLLLATGVLGGLATALVVFGQPISEVIRDNLPLGAAFVPVWTVARWVVAIGALALLFATFFYLAPNRDAPRWVWVSPGGLFATAVWMAASLAFSFYVSSFGSYAETYGSLTGVVVPLLWLYLSALAVVAGGELNAELERQAAMRTGQVARRAGATPRPASRSGRSGCGPCASSPLRSRPAARRSAASGPQAGRQAERRVTTMSTLPRSAFDTGQDCSAAASASAMMASSAPGTSA